MQNQSPRVARPVFLPALLTATAILAGLFLLGADGYQIIRFIVSILALITAVIAAQQGKWPWALPMVAVAIVWNPIYPLELEGTLWAAAHIVGAAVCLATALLLRVPEEPQPKRPQPKRR